MVKQFLPEAFKKGNLQRNLGKMGASVHNPVITADFKCVVGSSPIGQQLHRLTIPLQVLSVTKEGKYNVTLVCKILSIYPNHCRNKVQGICQCSLVQKIEANTSNIDFNTAGPF